MIVDKSFYSSPALSGMDLSTSFRQIGTGIIRDYLLAG
jgi:hypothetical protein